MNPDTQYLSHRLDAIEKKLDTLIQASAEREMNEWITTKDALALMSVSDRQLSRLISSGVIHGDAIRNVGTVKSPRYRYHRSRLLKQWLKRAPLPQ